MNIRVISEARKEIAKILRELETESGQLVLSIELDDMRISTAGGDIQCNRDIVIVMSEKPGNGWNA